MSSNWQIAWHGLKWYVSAVQSHRFLLMGHFRNIPQGCNMDSWPICGTITQWLRLKCHSHLYPFPLLISYSFGFWWWLNLAKSNNHARLMPVSLHLIYNNCKLMYQWFKYSRWERWHLLSPLPVRACTAKTCLKWACPLPYRCTPNVLIPSHAAAIQ